MLGLMQDRPLLISSLLDHAATHHAGVEIVSRTCEGPTVRTDFAGLAGRARQLANVLRDLGVGPGDRVATLAWNTHRHLELYFAVSGIGAVLHTVNPRLFPEQIDYIVNHGGAEILFFDVTFADLVATLQPKLSAVRTFVAMTDAAHLPGAVGGCLVYEDLVAAQPDIFAWPEFDERTASSLCYTSGTTGNPKGVLYSHRSTVLHSFLACASDGLKLSSADCVLLVVPLFHVNAWGIPYAAAMCGAKLVLPGPALDGRSVFELAASERCTLSLGVPTVWLGLFQHIDATPDLDLSRLKIERIVIGGSAPSRAILERFRNMGIAAIQAWGMSETSPLGTIGNLLPKHRDLEDDAQLSVLCKAGRAMYGVEVRIVDADGQPLPNEGSTAGNIEVRGPWVASGYFRGEGGHKLSADGWFPTGDVGTLDADGYIQITDRSKDVIKSGGEWISSIDLENAAAAHPAIAEAAVIGLPHPRWQERPLLVAVRKPGADPQPDELLAFLSERVAKWWLPNDVVFVDELPHTATGKLQKLALRERFRDHVFSN